MNKSLLKAWWPNNVIVLFLNSVLLFIFGYILNVKDAIPFGLSLLLLNVLYTIIKMCHITYISKKEMSEELKLKKQMQRLEWCGLHSALPMLLCIFIFIGIAVYGSMHKDVICLVGGVLGFILSILFPVDDIKYYFSKKIAQLKTQHPHIFSESKIEPNCIRIQEELQHQLHLVYGKQNELAKHEAEILKKIDQARSADGENPYRPRIQHSVPVATQTHPAESEGEGDILEADPLKKMHTLS